MSSTTDPREVVDLHRRNCYDLMLLDLQMPHMNGYEVLAALATEAPVSILVLSADPTQQSRSIQAGAKSFLSKPFVLAEVLQRVATLLAMRMPLPIMS